MGDCVLFGDCGICGKLSQHVRSVNGERVVPSAIQCKVHFLALLPEG